MGARLTRRQLLRRLLWGAGGIVAAEAVLYEPNTFVFRRVEVPIDDLPEAFDGYRIALFSDIHYPRRIHPEYIRRGVEIANGFQPDLLALPGDFTDKRGSVTVPKMAGLFDGAVAPDGIVGTLGNHDHWLDAPGVRRELADHTPVRLIENESFLVERRGQALAIGGVGDLWEGVVDPAKAFAGVAPETPRILLSHNPDVAEEMTEEVRIDLQLSGHTHGGEVYLPGVGAPILPSRYGQKFRAGLAEGRHHRVYVTCGLCSMHLARLCNPPEITGLVLRRRAA